MLCSMQHATLYYVHDPMCSWCWGFQPTWRKIKAELPEGVSVEYLLGGLARDSEETMPETMRGYLQQTWQRIHDTLDTEFNFAFWETCQPRRSTYPACRAVIAAAAQNADVAMIEAVQRAYYLRAMNPSDNGTLVTLADELGLDRDRFSRALSSPATQEELERQIVLSQTLGAQGFPSLVLDVAGSRWPIAVDYHDHEAVLAQIDRVLAG